jgi:putative transcriptional regulator
MKEELFAELLESAHEALEHAKGKRDLKTTVLPAPPKPMNARDVRRLRSRLDASQAIFASYLNVSTKLVQAWEADRRTPEGAALRLMRLAERAPELLLTAAPESRMPAKLAKRLKRTAGRRRHAARAKSA